MTGVKRVGILAVALAVGLTAGVVSADSDTEKTAGAVPTESLASAVFAGGCFWCVEADFDKVNGVVETISGYSGGTLENPTYEQVTYGDTGHYEVVKVIYDPQKVSYRALVDHLMRTVDPTDPGGQFCDRGDSYRTAIFADGADERAAAEAATADAESALGQEVVTPVLDAAPFYEAEGYHQDYYTKNPLKYKYYRWRCGRDERIEALWGEVSAPS